MMFFKNYLDKLIKNNNLTEEETSQALHIIISGGATPVQISSFLSIMTHKGLSCREIIGACSAIKEARTIPMKQSTGLDLELFSHYPINLTFPLGLLLASYGYKTLLLSPQHYEIAQTLGLNDKIDPQNLLPSLEQSSWAISPKFTTRNIHDLFMIKKELPFVTLVDIAYLLSPTIKFEQLILALPEDLVTVLAEICDRWQIDNYLFLTNNKIWFKKKGKLSSKKFIWPELNTSNLERRQNYFSQELLQFINGHNSIYTQLILEIASNLLVVLQQNSNYNDVYQQLSNLIEQGQLRQKLQEFIAINNKVLEEN